MSNIEVFVKTIIEKVKDGTYWDWLASDQRDWNQEPVEMPQPESASEKAEEQA